MILVVGATGVVGGMVSQALLQQGKAVRVLLRHNSPSEQLAGQGLATAAASLLDVGARLVYGDLRDIESLDKAVAGVETVICTANSALRSGEDNVENVDLNGNQALIVAAQSAGVKHFIFLSVVGASADNPVPFIQAKAAAEQSLRESSMDFTILAPTFFMETWPAVVVGMPASQGHPVTLVGKGDHRHSFISNRDVAAFMVAAVDNSAARNQYLPLGGPDAYTWTQVAELFGEVVGRPVSINFVAPGDPMPGMPDFVQMMLPGSETYESVLDSSGLAKTFGVEQTSLGDFFSGMMSR